MSIEQPTLQDFGAVDRAERRRERRREIILAEGGVYGRRSTEDHKTGERRCICRNCERPIFRGVAKVFGDNQGTVPCCSDCRVGTGNEQYERDATAIRSYYNDQGEWLEGGEE
jgi:hypothetical protein